MIEDKIVVAVLKWGDHPTMWPVPPMQMPKFWEIKKKRRLRELETVFGNLDQSSLDAFWGQPPQGAYEDCGGAVERKYRAMNGEDVADVVSYQDVINDMIEEANSKLVRKK